MEKLDENRMFKLKTFHARQIILGVTTNCGKVFRTTTRHKRHFATTQFANDSKRRQLTKNSAYSTFLSVILILESLWENVIGLL